MSNAEQEVRQLKRELDELRARLKAVESHTMDLPVRIQYGGSGGARFVSYHGN